MNTIIAASFAASIFFSSTVQVQLVDVPSGFTRSMSGKYSPVASYSRKILRHEALMSPPFPAIEMPGHASAFTAASSLLSTKNNDDVCTAGWAMDLNGYDVSSPPVFSFVHRVLSDVMRLLPSRSTHVGGDEATYVH